ncbi:MAG: hypothetical protein WC275_03070 [Bacilli bacterium]
MKSKTSKLLIAMLGIVMLVGCKPKPVPSVSEDPSVIVTTSDEPTTTEPTSVEEGEAIRRGTAADAITHRGELVLEVGEKVDVTYARTVEDVSRIEFKVEEGVAHDALKLYLENYTAEEGKRYSLEFEVHAAVAFVGIVNGALHDFARGDNSVTIFYDETSAPSLTFIFATDEEGLGLKNNNVSFKNFAFTEKVYGSEEDIVVDGNNFDWVNIQAYENTVGVKGVTEETEHKSVDFYATLTSKGLYLLADAQHDLYLRTEDAWWQNTNFEFFIKGGNQYFVSAKGEGEEFTKSANVTEAAWVTTAVEVDGKANFHTIVEAFVSLADLPEGAIVAGEIRVGFAWKTPGDPNTGGEAAGGGLDDYWVPAGTWTNNAAQTFVNKNGIFKETQLSFEPETLTIDGDLSDWTNENVLTNKIYLEGDGETTHKNVTFYAFLNVEGLFVAAVAEHDVYIDNEDIWHMNTNFEYFFNGGNQNFVAANGAVSFGAGKIVNSELGGEGKAAYRTVAEAFLPRAVYDSRSAEEFAQEDPILRVGFAWKTNGDLATGLGGSGGGPDAWWFEAGHFPSNPDEQYYVTQNGAFRSNPNLG